MKHIDIITMDPLVSIIVPCYNAEKFIAQTLDSLCKQQLQDIEIIIVNDGSTDNSKSIIEKFFFDRRIRYIEKENGGTGSALNLGHSIARGKYLTWCSADNVYFENFALTLFQGIAMAEQQGIEYVYSDFIFVNERGQRLREVIHTQPQPAHDLVNGYDLGMSFMYTKKLWDKVGDYKSGICEDYDWSVRAAEHTKFALIRQILAAFRVHGGQISGNRKEEELEAANACKALALEMIQAGKYDDTPVEVAAGFNPRLVE
jgi:glycosyltransferase involved in cell wall biosynthesis